MLSDRDLIRAVLADTQAQIDVAMADEREKQ